MACNEETREINGVKCFTRQWNATKAMQKKAELIKMGGETMLKFVEGKPDILSLMALEKEAKPDELVALIKEFVCSVRVDGKEITPAMFDIEYSGDLWQVIELFAFACEVQYKNFFESGLERLNDLYPS